MTDITTLERVKIQAEVLVPLVKAFQKEMGEERANAIAKEALASVAFKLGQMVASQGTEAPPEKVAAAFDGFAAGDALDMDVLEKSADAFDVDVTGCRYAKFYQELGEPELGFLFVCMSDPPFKEGVSSELELTRTQTIMQGASHCDFKWRMKKQSST